MAWIETVSYKEAKGKLKALYDRIKGPDNNVDNIMMAHSLRPHTMEGHMTLYKYVLHHPGNKLPKWLLEAIGTYVSILNNCSYCIEHHFAGLRRLLENEQKAMALRHAFEKDDLTGLVNAGHITARTHAAFLYAKTLTRAPDTLSEEELDNMRLVGLTDGEILEINQVTAYFAYANRTVLGLGIHTEGDIIGLSPNDDSDPDNWSHS